MLPCITLSIIKVWIKGKVEQSKEWSSTPLHLGVVATEKGAFESPTLLIMDKDMIMLQL